MSRYALKDWSVLKSMFYSKKARRHALAGHPIRWKMKRAFQIDFLKRVGLRPDHYLLDIGCGTLRGGLPIIRYLEDGHYYGVDIRHQVLKEAQAELEEENLTDKSPRLSRVESLGAYRADQQFDVIWAFAVLFHLEDPIVHECLQVVSGHLKPAGAFYANVNIGQRKTGRWGEFPVIWRTLDWYRTAAESRQLHLEDLGRLIELGHRSGIGRHDRQRMMRFTKL